MHDWSDFVRFEPEATFRPESIAELEGLLTDIAEGRVEASELRVLGSMHSCARICESRAVLDVTALPKTLEWAPDLGAVTISANHTLHETLDLLAENDKSLGGTGGTYHQTLAGLISTSTAPATPKLSLYDALHWVEYVTIDPASKRAVTRRVHLGEPDFGGMVCSLGAIGVITRVHVSVRDQPYFEAVHEVVPMMSILGDLEGTSQKYDFWRVNWVPDSDDALLWAAKRIPKEKADANGDYEPDGAENMLAFLFKHWDKLAFGKPGPLLDPVMEAVYDVMAAFYNMSSDRRVTGPLRNILPVDKRAPLRVAMAEWAFAPSDLERVLACCRKYFDAHGWPNIPTEIELSKTDEWWMSPWNWPGLPYVVKMNFMYLTEICTTTEERELLLSHLRGLWNALDAENIPFKAHWGKINFLTPERVARDYGIARFRPLIHPLFVNPYLRERLG